jgi:regulator of protease activity HflC (stomatin/prohibitin superfamily)
MEPNETFQVLVGVGVGFVTAFLLGMLANLVVIQVEDEHVVLVTSWGRLVAQLDRPGPHLWLSRLLPWVRARPVSLARDFRVFHHVHANDRRGTTVAADLWVELRVVDAAKALYAVEDWDKATINVVVHAAMSVLGSRDFQQILDDRSELGQQLQPEVSAETERWGVRVEQVYIRNVSLLPEVSRQVMGTVAARLDHARAVVEEQGRLDGALLDATTARQVARLVGEAKSQYALAVGRALERMKARPAVFDAYTRLHELAQVRGNRTVAFLGFKPSEVRAIDAAMLPERTPVSGPAGGGAGEGEPGSS